ncbi:hypothetical protein M8J77_010206 [Diaphorina citri]|nr:hypothetical protein M8J77_010206 [Diaphorina citri]
MSTRIFIGGFSYRVRERDIERFCDRYGKIREISMKNKYAFVEFEDYRDADDAVYELNGKSLLGERVTVEIAKGIDRSQERGRRGYGSYRAPPPRRGWGHDRDDRYGPPTRSDHRLIVENLSSRVSWQDLKDFMRQVGEVCYADAHKRHRNEGVVEFESSSDMKKALDKLDNAELNGRRIRLIEDKPRGGGRGRSRSSSSRSRSKSRSRSRSSKSRSPRSRSKSGSPRKSKSKAKSVSRSPSPSKTRKRSRSRSDSRARKVSKGSASPPEKKRSRSRSRSHSARSGSASPVNRNGDKSPARSDNE